MLKELFICCSDYQLINSINIKRTMFSKTNSDIVIFNNKVGTFDLADRLQDTGLFENVFVYSDYFPGLHRYMRGNYEQNTFFGAVRGSLKNIYINLFKYIKGKEWGLNKKIYNTKTINFSQYNNLFGVETESFFGEIIDLILKYNNCQNNFIDEGIGCYLSYALNRKHKIDNVYLYEPKLASYKNKSLKIIKIPKINVENREFINFLNYIFDFKDCYRLNTDGRVIFFDQNTHPMPKYLRNAGVVKKFVLRNAYQKHLKEHLVYENKMKLFEILAQKIKPQRILVKLHPRSTNDYIDDYKKCHVNFFSNGFVPWELFVCNYKIKNSIWITMFSSAVCVYDFAIKNNNVDNNKYIFLYRIVNKISRVKDYEAIDEFFVNFKKLNNEKVFLPNSIEELLSDISSITKKESKNLI